MPKHVDTIDNALDALASDSEVTHAEYVEALEDLHYRIGAALDAARHEAHTGL